MSAAKVVKRHTTHDQSSHRVLMMLWFCTLSSAPQMGFWSLRSIKLEKARLKCQRNTILSSGITSLGRNRSFWRLFLQGLQSSSLSSGHSERGQAVLTESEAIFLLVFRSHKAAASVCVLFVGFSQQQPELHVAVSDFLSSSTLAASLPGQSQLLSLQT